MKTTNKQMENKIFTNKNIFRYFLIAIAFCSLIMIQSYRINKMNIEILDLEAKVKNVTMVNDSLEGEVMSKRNLNKIEKIAINKYGMIKPSQKNYNYVSVKKDNNNSLANAKNEAENKQGNNSLTNFFSGFANN